jgi:hypothetical protein
MEVEAHNNQPRERGEEKGANVGGRTWFGISRGSTRQVPASFFGIEKNKWA